MVVGTLTSVTGAVVFSGEIAVILMDLFDGYGNGREEVRDPTQRGQSSEGSGPYFCIESSKRAWNADNLLVWRIGIDREHAH